MTKKILTFSRKWPLPNLGPYNMVEAHETIEFDTDEMTAEDAWAEICREVLEVRKQNLDYETKPSTDTPKKSEKKTVDIYKDAKIPEESSLILDELPWRNYTQGSGSWIFSNLKGAEVLTEKLATCGKDKLVLDMNGIVYEVGFSGREVNEDSGLPKFITRTPIKTER